MSDQLQNTEILFNKPEKLEQLCRVCLSENTEQSKCVFDENESSCIASMLMLCARVQIACADGLPDIICAQCLGDLEAANSFRLRCELSDSLLRKLYTNTVQTTAEPVGQVAQDPTVVKEEVSCDWIKSELKDDEHDSDTQYDPLIENSSFEGIEIKPKNHKRYKKSGSAPKRKKNKIKKAVDLESCTDSQNPDCSVSESRDKKPKIKLFICKICGRPLKSRKSLENHLHSMHNGQRNIKIKLGSVTGYGKGRRFNCSECSYSSHRSQALIYHSRTHTGEKPYVCDICQACFAQPGTLNGHMRLHSDKMYFTCPECGKQFKLKNKLERHKLVHSDVKSFICQVCNKGLKTKQSYEIHKKRHLNIRDYSCEQCGRTFVSLEDLINHRRRHSDVKRFECHICTFKTRMKRALIGHLRRHTGEKTLKCELCEYMAYDIYALKLHMKKHTREKNYTCPVCQMKFIHSTSVNRHMMRIHKIEYKVSDHSDRRTIK